MSIQIDNSAMFAEKLQNGINIFAGAGFSKLPNTDGSVLPDATSLCEEICEKFSISSSYGNDLEKVANIANQRVKQQFQAFLRERYTVSTYNPLYDALNLVSINAFITTNIDNIIQCVMDNSERYSLHNIVEYGAAKQRNCILPFIPLHGNVKDLGSNLYFGKSELATVDVDNRDLFSVMHAKLLEAPTLFWGYGFHDNAIERTIAKLLDDGLKEIWIQCMPGSDTIQYFRDLNCYVIEGTTEELLLWIKKNIKHESSPVSQKSHCLDSLKQYFIPSRNMIETISISDYFTNGVTEWYCILSGYPYETKSVNSIYEASLTNKNVIAVGIPFSGKTTILMQVAAKMDAPIKLIIPTITMEEARRIINVLGDSKAIVFIDKCCDDVQITGLFMKYDNIRVVGFADDYAFESSKHILNSRFVRIEVGELEIGEAQKVYEKIPPALRLPSFTYKNSEDEKFSMLEMLSNNVQGVLTEDRVHELLSRVKSASQDAFEAIAVTAYLVSNNSSLNTDVLISYFDTTEYSELKHILNLVSGYLKELSVDIIRDPDDQDYYSLRSRLFAQLTMSVLKNHLKKPFAKVVRKLLLNVSPYRIFNYRVFKRSAFDARLFKTIFGSSAHDLYEHIYRFDDSIYTLQQWALYKAYLKDYGGAFADIEKAINISPNNFSIRNSRAIILFEANKNKKSPKALDSLKEAMTILQNCYYSDKRKVYHAQKYAEFSQFLSQKWDVIDYLLQAREWLETIIRTQESTSLNTKRLKKAIDEEIQAKHLIQ